MILVGTEKPAMFDFVTFHIHNIRPDADEGGKIGPFILVACAPIRPMHLWGNTVKQSGIFL